MISAEAFLRRNPVASQDMPIAEQHVQSKPSGRFSRRGRDAAVVEDPNDLDACREAALRLLDAAPRASGALRERLLAKGYGEAIVDEVIERLIRVQLIDDGAYAESAVRYCAGRMMGRRGTVMELARKGVDRKLAEQVCDEAEQNGIFEDAAWELGRQIARKTHGLDRRVRQRRLWSAGGRKGHSPETLRRVAAALLVSPTKKGHLLYPGFGRPGRERTARMAIHLDLTLPPGSSSLPDDTGEQPLPPSAWPCSR